MKFLVDLAAILLFSFEAFLFETEFRPRLKPGCWGGQCDPLSLFEKGFIVRDYESVFMSAKGLDGTVPD